MSFINFESSRVKEEQRNDKRKAREAVLEKAEADYKRRKEREQRAAERGEDKWMLPSLDAQLQPDAKKEKKKKDKKEKKKKKDKKLKHKSKKKHDSSDSSDSSDAEQWIEKGADAPSAPSARAQRDEWMTLPALFPCVSRNQLKATKRQEQSEQDEEAQKKKFLLDNPGQSERELNPFWKDGGKGLPQVEEPMPDSLSLPANSAGDHGLAWLRRALRRVQEQATEQGRSEEAVAAERWGSLQKLKNMLQEAEQRCRAAPRDRRGRGGRRGGRVQGPAPRPREYEDWREDPSAGESAAQSEVVGDKSRYRAWLGIKDPPPRQETSESDDDTDHDHMDDPPVVVGMEGMVIEEKVDKKEKEKEKLVDKDSSEEEEETDGKILFRSSKSRKEKKLATSSTSKAKTHLQEKINAFGRKTQPGGNLGKYSEMHSDDDDKLFEEWRSERKKDSDESDEEEEEEKAKEKDRVARKDLTKKDDQEKHKKNQQSEEYQEIDNRKSKIHQGSTEDDLVFRGQRKNRDIQDGEEEKRKENFKQCKQESGRDIIRHSDFRDSAQRDLSKEKMRDRDRESKDRREIREERDGSREHSRDRRSEEQDRRLESNRQRFDASHREKRRDDERIGRRNENEDEKSMPSNKDRREKDDHESRSKRHEDEGGYRNRDVERDSHRNRPYRRDYEDRSSEKRESSEHGSSRSHHAGARRTEIPGYLQKHRSSPSSYERVPPRRYEAFQKPEEDASDSFKRKHPDFLNVTSSSRSSSGAKNWMKKDFRKADEKPVPKEQSPPPKPAPKPPLTQLTQRTEDITKKEEEKLPDVVMSDAEMNALGAKVMKAEIMGNQALAAKLKGQLERAQSARQKQGQAKPAAGPAGRKPEGEETVVLTRTDAKGFVRPLAEPEYPEPSGGRRRPQRVATHGADGLRERYFPDDDRYTLENMFQKEKMTTMEEANEEFCRLAAKGAAQSEDFDDIFAEKMTREKAPGKLQVLERNRAIREHKRVERSLDSCTRCFDSPRMMKHLMIALGNKVYLSLPTHQSLTEGHCLLSPIHHVSCGTQLDEDVWEEMTSFRKALVAMFSKQDEDCVFFESAMHFKRFPHMTLECVPLPREIGDTAPIYFKKAIMESEAEWSMNKKLVDLKGKGVRRAVPKGLPYFSVDFGLDDGFAHVIEEEKLFPENFAQEIVGGMLDLDHCLWRKPRREDFDTQRKKVLKFAELWKEFDVTKKAVEDSTSSSSESDKE